MNQNRTASPAFVLIIGFVTVAVQFGLAILAFGGWISFFRHRALIVLAIVTIMLLFAASFTQGNLSSGKKEDRGNRWVFSAFGILALASAIDLTPSSVRIGVRNHINPSRFSAPIRAANREVIE